jgi:ribonuclease T1
MNIWFSSMSGPTRRRTATTLCSLVTASLFVGAVAIARGPEPLPEIATAYLPPEAQRTLGLIKHGGPFPYPRDGVVFNNRERILPSQHRGYYHEYTVPTPNSKNRGARRIIAGDSREFYYTDDHYQSFKRIRE